MLVIRNTDTEAENAMLIVRNTDTKTDNTLLLSGTLKREHHAHIEEYRP